ncbi:unnamed protein product [Cylicocyclus nassatus]|uniref:DOMON domain-containing protein n=1 Tax=Cylicocyclus nassatus TaxID=53992 RepID=A0AA36GHG3_CYLNA|nr:unnamed protein product [Cylicocyclus nassatus]
MIAKVAFHLRWLSASYCCLYNLYLLNLIGPLAERKSNVYLYQKAVSAYDNANTYMAIGFSDDNSMGNDAVTQCNFYPNSQPSAHFSYNVGKSNQPLSESEQQVDERGNLILALAQKGESGMYCSFRQRGGNGNIRHVPNLNNSYYIFLVRGVARSPTTLNMHSLNPSSPDFPYISSYRISVAQKGVSPNSPQSTDTWMSADRRRWLIKIHVAAIFIATTQAFGALWFNVTWANALIIVYIAIAVLCFVVLQILSCMMSKPPSKIASATATIYFMFILFSFCVAVLFAILMCISNSS